MLLTPTFLEDFYSTNEPFAIIGGHLFEIHPALNNPRDFFDYHGKKLELVETDSIASFERQYMDVNKNQIEKFLRKKIEFYNSRIESERETIESLPIDTTDSRKVSRELFLRYDVFNAYLRKHSANTDFEFQFTHFNDIQQIVQDDNISLDNIVDGTVFRSMIRGNVLFAFGKGFCLEKSPTTQEEYLFVRNHIYVPNATFPISDLVSVYSDTLREKVLEKIDTSISSYESVAGDLLERRKKLQQFGSDFPDLVEDKINGARIGVTQKGNDGNREDYEIYLQLLPYIIRKNDTNYLFRGVTVSVDVSFIDDTVRLQHEPVVTSPENYHHPFVWSDSNSICYNGNVKRFANEGVTFGATRINSPSQREYAANNIATALNIARKVLQSGYRGNTVHPVNSLNTSNFQSEYASAQTCQRNVLIFEN